MSLTADLLRNAITHPEQTAWVELDKRDRIIQYTWRDIGSVVVAVARRMQQLGFQSGQHVGLISENGLAPVVCLFALRLVGTPQSPSGAVDVPIDYRHPVNLQRQLLVQADIKQLLYQPDASSMDGLPGNHHSIGDLVRKAKSDRVSNEELHKSLSLAQGQDPASVESIMFTSGTTDRPQGVMLTHENLQSNAAAKLSAASQFPEDLRLSILPYSHAYGRTCDIGTWVLSRSQFSTCTGFDGLQKIAPSLQPTLINGVPYIAHKIHEHLNAGGTLNQLGLGQLRLLGCGGGRLDRTIFEYLTDKGITIIQGYGLTETGPVICSATPYDACPGSVGKPVEGVELRLDSQGQIVVRSPGVMRGYFNAPQETRARIQDRWLQTGDLGEFDENGRLRILGRCDDMITLATGHNVMPTIVESRLMDIAGLRHVIITASKTQGLLAWFEGLDDCSREQIQRMIAETLVDFPSYMVPRQAERFPFDLSVASGTLTAKGTVRRQAVLQKITELKDASQ